MAGSIVAERMLLVRFLVGRSFGAVSRAFRAPLHMLALLSGSGPERLLIAPQDIRTADATIANDIYAGYFSFAAKIGETHGQSPFLILPPSEAWAAQLHGFGWLRHLRAADTTLARANARALVEDWISHFEHPSDAPCWQPAIAARRLSSWLSQSPLILEGADRAFYKKFMKALGKHGLHLQSAVENGLTGEPRLQAIIALSNLSLCAQDTERLQRRATRWLVDELKHQILHDGGHIGRNPQVLVDLLLDLLPLRQAFATRAVTIPQTLIVSIDRMMPMLRLFRHGEGTLALFNGMGVTAPHALSTILAYDDVQNRPLMNAPFSGYQRLDVGEAIVVMDAGCPPPPEFSERAHAGCLSFELSVRQQRVVVNCGAPDTARADLLQAARSTAAHSTLVVSDTSSSRFGKAGALGRWFEGRIIASPNVTSKRIEQANGVGVEASHDGYESRFGLIHERIIFMAADGQSVSGEDRLRASGRRVPGGSATPFDVRFHLHPQVRAVQTKDGQSVHLLLADGETWQFSATDHAVQLEESIFFSGPDGARKTDQLVISTTLRAAQSVSWTFERITDRILSPPDLLL